VGIYNGGSPIGLLSRLQKKQREIHSQKRKELLSMVVFWGEREKKKRRKKD